MKGFRALSFASALLAASPAWAVTQGALTFYVDTAGNGGVVSNSGTTDASTPLYNSVAGGTGASGVACAATCTATAGTAYGAATASASWAAGGTAISFTAANCTGVLPGEGIWDVTAGGLGLIGVVASSSFSVTCNLTLMTGGALRASVGSTDTLYLSSVVTLSSAATLSATPGCTSEGSGNYLCDGTQAIFLNAATNTNTRVFIIAGFTSCAGSGTCLIALGASTTAGSGSPNPTGVTTQTWQIGGRQILPDSANLEGAVIPGSTIIVNSTLATCGASTSCFTFRIAGDSLAGPVTLQGKGSTYPTLTNTSNASVVSSSGNPSNYTITGLTISASGTAAAVITGGGLGDIVSNNKISNSSGSAACVSLGASAYVLNNDIGPCVLSGITTNSTASTIAGNYIHGATTDGIVITGASPTSFIIDNIISTCGGWSINLSAASVAFNAGMLIEGNTLYNSTLGNLNVASKWTVVRLKNNILYDTVGTAVNIVYPAVPGIADVSVLTGGEHLYNDFFSSGSATNFTNVTVGSTDVLTDPVFANAGTGNFAVSTTGGAYNAGGPHAPIDTTTTNYRSIGAAQLQGVAGGGAGIIGGGL